MATVPEEHDAQVHYTIVLNGRDPSWPQLTAHEAHEALVAGIRFSIFNEMTGEFNIAIPYSTMRMVGRDTLTIMQD